MVGSHVEEFNHVDGEMYNSEIEVSRLIKEL